jgi:hypothetical protein
MFWVLFTFFSFLPLSVSLGVAVLVPVGFLQYGVTERSVPVYAGCLSSGLVGHGSTTLFLLTLGAAARLQPRHMRRQRLCSKRQLRDSRHGGAGQRAAPRP